MTRKIAESREAPQPAPPPSNRPDAPIIIGGDERVDACGDTGEIVGLDPQGDGFLSVRSGPGGQPFQEKDRLFNGNEVYICAKSGPWFAAVYNDKRDLEQSCGVDKPWRTRQPYTGPCRYGWIHSTYVRNAGAKQDKSDAENAPLSPDSQPPPPVRGPPIPKSASLLRKTHQPSVATTISTRLTSYRS
jgi:hypothetical protein